MISNSRNFYFSIVRIVSLSVFTVYFWVIAVKAYLQASQIYECAVLYSLKKVSTITIDKAQEIQLYFGKLGVWYIEPDFSYFIMILVLNFVLLFTRGVKFHSRIILMLLSVFAPQIVTLFILLLLFTSIKKKSII